MLQRVPAHILNKAVALYPSILVESGVLVVMEKLDKQEDDSDLFGLARVHIRSLFCAKL